MGGKQRHGLHFGLAGNAALDALVAESVDNLRFPHAMSSKAKPAQLCDRIQGQQLEAAAQSGGSA